MIIDEQDAGAYWCPFAKSRRNGDFGEPHKIPLNRDDIGRQASGSYCLGEECMAWRWARERNPDWKPQPATLSMSQQHPDDMPSPWRKSETHGYCGLAGAL